ncbi:Up in starvation [Rhizopus azygosporus]|uniref:Up in starvation n=1 Tax=Rhizopus azygosporus TaxID=86630 RepID=A0A367K518_RHIAZ|nr:Up in starvation [Rhizopus azygosporus]
MPPKRRNSGQRSAPKQFRCTGYGDCNMVFTRSEHLARHERKHTGEKPYKCIVEGCERMFSRFDNMMQHTQTHDKERKKTAPTEAVKDHSKNKKARASMTDDPVTESPIQMQEERHPWVQQRSDLYASPFEYSSMVNNRTLPLPHRRASISTPVRSLGYRSPYPYSLPPSPVKTQFHHHPSHLPNYDHYYYQKPYNVPRNRSSWPIKEEYNEFDQTRRSSISTVSTDSGHSHSPPSFHHHDFHVKRRISIDALQTPIEKLRTIQLDEKPLEKDAIDITQDEYEALEAFSQFHTSPVVGTLPITSSPLHSPNLSSQVCAIRQRVPTLRESFSRPASHHYG